MAFCVRHPVTAILVTWRGESRRFSGGGRTPCADREEAERLAHFIGGSVLESPDEVPPAPPVAVEAVLVELLETAPAPESSPVLEVAPEAPIEPAPVPPRRRRVS